ncbi:MAG: hypothetical protein CMI35_17095 [Owenweeksia sp.]|nr:hypothetical protein [Owenweeksia sp.]
MIKVLMFSLIASVAACSCEKGWGCDVEGGYQFEIPATLSPALDTFHIGDTISIENDFSDQVYDRQTQQTYSLENFEFYPGTAIIRIDTLSKWGKASLNYALDDFQLIIPEQYNYEIFTFGDGSKIATGEFLYANSRYSLQLKLIPQESGLFIISHGIGLGSQNSDDRQEFEGKCKDVSISGIAKLNGGSDNNISFLNNSPDPHWNDWVLQKPNERYHHSGAYTFYVVE